MRALIILPILFLSACTSLSKEQCVAGQWYDMGYTDGIKGRLRTQFNDYAKACHSYGVTPSLIDYDMGRERGLVDFCMNSTKPNLRYTMLCQRSIDQNRYSSPGVINRAFRNLGTQTNTLDRSFPRF